MLLYSSQETRENKRKFQGGTSHESQKILNKLVAVLSGVTLAAGVSFAADNIVKVDADYLFVPEGFDDNDNVQVVLDGWLNSSCDVAMKPEVKMNLEDGIIEVNARAQKGNHICMPVLIRYTAIADLGVLPMGEYNILSNNGAMMENLIVEEATSAGPDEYMYARVDEAMVDYDQTYDAC